MKNKIIYLAILSVFMINLVSAISINVNSLDYSSLNTGDKIIVDINVTGERIYQDLRFPYLTWIQSNSPNSWVGCNSIKLINSTNWNWLCILTVTPYMNTASDVYIKTNTHSGNNTEILLGTFQFNGTAFPNYDVNCSITKYCSKYKQICEKVCVRYDNNGNCRNYKKVCTTTDECLKYTTKKICKNR